MRENKNSSRDYWNKDDLKVYILLYCANADLILKKEEKHYIHQKIGSAKYDAIREEFNEDNDHQSIAKIYESLGHLGYNLKQIDALISEVKELFWSDGKFDQIEQAVFRQLKHILNQ